MVQYGGLVSSNAVSCGVYGRESDTNSGLSPSLPVLPSVLTTPPQHSALSFIYNRRHIILAAVSVTDKRKRHENILCQASHIFILFLSLLLTHLRSVPLHVQ